MLNDANKCNQTIETLAVSIQSLRINMPAEPPADWLKKMIFLYKDKTLETLNELFQTYQSLEPEHLLKQLEIFLAMHWTLTCSTLVSYTALPRDEITLLLCEIAELIAERTGCSAIQILMPTLCIESLSDDFPDLNALSLAELLSSYILGQEGKYLIPRKILNTRDDLSAEKWPNPYYDHSTHPEYMACLNHEEISRLFEYSAQGRALKNAYGHYHFLLNEKDNLLARLEQLCSALYLNSASGLGKENAAAQGAYPAIFQFYLYYQQLDSESLASIPNELKLCIANMLELAGSKDRNAEGTESLETCIASLRHHLLNAMAPCRAKLSGIGLEDKKHAEIIQAAQAELELCREMLKAAIDKQMESDGYDRLGLTAALLEYLKFNVSIRNHQDFRNLMSLPAQGIAVIAKNPAIQSAFSNRFYTLGDLVCFLQELPLDKMQVVLEVMAPDLPQKFIKNHLDFQTLTLSFYDEKLALIFRVLDQDLMKFFSDSYKLVEFIDPFSPIQAEIILQAMRPRFSEILHDGYQFRHLWCALSASWQSLLYESVKERLFNCLKSGADVSQVMQCLPEEAFNDFFTRIKPELSRIIKTGLDFKYMLTDLSDEKKAFLFEYMKASLPSMIDTGDQFSEVMETLLPEHKASFFELCKTEFSRIVQGVDCFQYIWKTLSEEQQLFFFKTMSLCLPDIIETARSFHDFMESLSENFRPDACNIMLPHVLQLIHSGDDLSSILTRLSSEQRSWVLQQIDHDLPRLIQGTLDMFYVFSYLDEQRRGKLFETLTANLCSIIKPPFSPALNVLNPEQRSLVFREIIAKYPVKEVLHASEYKELWSYFSKEECSELFERVKDKLPGFILDATDFTKVMECFSQEQGVELCRQMHGEFPRLVKHSDDFISLCNSMSSAQCELFCQALEPHVKNFILNEHCLKYILQKLPTEKCRILLQAIKEKISLIIKGYLYLDTLFSEMPEDTRLLLCEVLSFSELLKNEWAFYKFNALLSDNECLIFYKNIAENPPSYLNETSGLLEILDELPPQRILCFFDELKELFCNIQTLHEFSDVVHTIPPEAAVLLCEVLKGQFPRLINSSCQFKSVLQCLPEGKPRKIVFDAMKNDLPAFIQEKSDLMHITEYLSMTQRDELYQAGIDLSFCFTTRESFSDILKTFSAETNCLILEDFKERFDELVADKTDFFVMAKYANNEQFLILCHAIRKKFLSWFKNCVYMPSVFNSLTEDQCRIFCEELSDKFSCFFTSKYNISYVLRAISPEKCKLLLSPLSDSLRQAINNGADAYRVIEDLSAEKRKLFFLAIQYFIPEIIQDNQWFNKIYSLLDNEQQTLFCELMKNHFPNLIQNVSAFNQTCRLLNHEQKTLLCEAMENHFQTFIYSEDDLSKSLEHLADAQKDILLKKLAHFPVHIETVEQFNKVILQLNAGQRTLFCEALINHFPNIIHQTDDLKRSLQYLSATQRDMLLDDMQYQLPVMITDNEHLRRALYWLDEAQSHRISQTIIEAQPHLLDPDNLERFYQLPADMPEVYKVKRFFFRGLTEQINQKSMSFEKKKDRQVAETLYLALNEAATIFFQQDPTEETWQSFKGACDDAIKIAEPVLQQHRHWADFIPKLALCIASLGVIPLVLCVRNYYHTGHFFFSVLNTDTADKLNLIKDNIKELQPAPVA